MNSSVTPDFDKLNGLLPVVAQDADTRDVLMVAFMNREAYEKTIRENVVTYYSRSRDKLWTKGETSGNIQKVREIYFDCDQDTLLILVEQIGKAACHKGYHSCFYRRFEDGALTITGEKVFDPEKIYKTESSKK